MITKTYEAVKRIKQSVEAKWLELPGVNGVGVGHQQAKTASETFVIQVYVNDIDAVKDVLPKQIEGVAVELRKGRFLPHN